MKRTYVCPKVEIIKLESGSLFVHASPGVSGEYNPDQPIGAPRWDFDYFNDDEIDKEFNY